ncbi:MAG TPA: valine--tRNA ligase, partial [Flammeovirgaceae bacterium]|nr:valine--tRNA ligase [Flammeovirgaceae bacterium]
GKDRFVVRQEIVQELQAAGHLVKVEDYTNNVGFSERTDAVIEPKLSTQWFVKMKELTKPAYEHVMNDDIRLVPPKFKNMYRHWMENVRDWCISRQLWWGHQIPAWYLPDGSFVVAHNEEEALQLAREKDDSLTADDLQRDPDVLDTWFSSGLWPISVFDGFKDPDGPDINYYYPTNDLVTAPEILFFWVARMIMFGYEYRGEKPFRNVYLTGIVRDKQGRKMSKSLGNSPDPLELIARYGADGVRTGMLFSSPAGNDLLFDEKLCEQGRNFNNKIWNAFRLVKGWQGGGQAHEQDEVAIAWFRARFNEALTQIEDHFAKFRISDALMTTYKLVWDDFCSRYLEMVKPAFGQPLATATLEQTVAFFEDVLKLIHPFMPFISEEIWQGLRPRTDDDYLIVAPWPATGAVDKELLKQGEMAFEVISQLRNLRSSKGLATKEKLTLLIKTTNPAPYERFGGLIRKMANLETIDFVQAKPQEAAGFVMRSDEFYVPLPQTVDVAQEREKLEKELAYTRGFLQSVQKKLSNEKFVNNAPKQVVANERQKLADAQARLKALQEQLNSL